MREREEGCIESTTNWI